MKHRHSTAFVLAFAGALGIAGCGGDDSAEAPADTLAAAATSSDTATTLLEPTGSTVPDADFNEADVAFAQGMIPHHRQAVEMADIALEPAVGASDDVVDLAGRIQAAQEPEIETMTAWLAEWGEPLPMDSSGGSSMDDMDAMDDMEGMEGMMSAEEMDTLSASTGAQFDTMWLEMMIRHHEGAIAMAETVKVDGSNSDVASLADDITQAQESEITEMQELLG